jgi:hypothetical protein
MQENGLNFTENLPVLSYNASRAEDLCLKVICLVSNNERATLSFASRRKTELVLRFSIKMNIVFYINSVDDMKPLNISRIIIRLTGEIKDNT